MGMLVHICHWRHSEVGVQKASVARTDVVKNVPRATSRRIWEAFMVLLAIRHFVSPVLRGKIILVGDALGVWYGMVRMSAKSQKINEMAKELALHLAPLGHELVGIHVWSEGNVIADALSRMSGRELVPPGLRLSWKFLRPRGPSEDLFEVFERGIVSA